jgi:hypothetical protein
MQVCLHRRLCFRPPITCSKSQSRHQGHFTIAISLLHLEFGTFQTMAHTAKRNPPFRAEHLGSLLRPEELIQKRYQVADGKASEAELAPLEDKCIKEIVDLQKECGFHAVGDGKSRVTSGSSWKLEVERPHEPCGPCTDSLLLPLHRKASSVDTCSGVDCGKPLMVWKKSRLGP